VSRSRHGSSADPERTPAWAVLSAAGLATVYGVLAFAQTAAIDCKHHTVDACIPAVELLFGVGVAALTFAWLVTSSGRGRSLRSGLALTVTTVAIWVTVMVVGGPLVCPDPGANDVLCPFGLVLGAVTSVTLAIGCWRLQRSSR
jgi:hypothetical protein